MATIERVTEATTELVTAFERLLPQLAEEPVQLGFVELAEMVAAPSTTLFIARGVGGQIQGAATLLLFRIPSGRRARIESLIVDGEARGAGIGRALCEAAIGHARILGAEAVDLTSSHSRIEANALYPRLGFELRATNVFRKRL
jgi:ribosomal protein S18 acetylase RimI-like enzyme